MDSRSKGGDVAEVRQRGLLGGDLHASRHGGQPRPGERGDVVRGDHRGERPERQSGLLGSDVQHLHERRGLLHALSGDR